MSAWVVMGVAGCGKSSLAHALAHALGRPFLEGDAFHSAAARARMASGEALTEADRAPWLAALAAALQAQPEAVLAASLLRRAHRDRLRAALPGLRFVHLELTAAQARARCAARSGHFFPAALVDSQFAALESTAEEPDVLRLDALRPLPQLLAHCLP